MNILYRDFRRLAEALSGYEALTAERFREQTYDARETAFLYYPPTKHVRNPWPGYAACRRYFWYHKRGQRNVIGQYFNIPRSADEGEPPYIVRPLRHFGGRKFFVADSEEERRAAEREIDGGSYAMELIRRTREFRAFFVGGDHTTTMLKSLEEYGYAEAENIPPTDDDELQRQPWNRDQMGTRYLTITREVNDKLTGTSFYDDAEDFMSDYPFDVLAIDVAYNDNDDSYSVFETNFAPQCTVESTLNPMVEAINQLQRPSIEPR